MKKLIQHGNSAALIIDKPILELLNMDVDTPVEVSTDGKTLTMSPVRDQKVATAFRAALDKVNASTGRRFVVSPSDRSD